MSLLNLRTLRPVDQLSECVAFLGPAVAGHQGYHGTVHGWVGGVRGRPAASGLGDHRWVIGQGAGGGQYRSPQSTGPVVVVGGRLPAEVVDDPLQ